MHTARTPRRLLWLVPALGLAACGKKAETPQAAAAPPAAPAAAPAPTPVTVTMAAKNGSRMTGTATLTATGDSTAVEVKLEGGRPGTKYPSHIHAGTCEKPGEVVAPLGSVTVGSDKTGSSTTTVATSVLDSARTKYGSLLVQSHLPNMKPAACADLPAQ